jgi:branched-chain amino acid transport system ATP-binding protein
VSTPALEIRSLRKSFAGLAVTQDVSLSVAPGERRLLLGPNGAGKTTLFNQVTGDILPDAGEILVFGRNVTRLAPHRRARLSLARTYQVITLFPRETLERNVVLALLGLRRTRWDLWRPLRADRALLAQAREALARVGLAGRAQEHVAALAYGEKRRLEIALALAQQPRLLLLDEPLAGLSAEERSDVRTLIASLPRDMAVVMIEHDMDTALDLAETVTVLQFGRVIVDGPRDEVIADPRTREVYLGT